MEALPMESEKEPFPSGSGFISGGDNGLEQETMNDEIQTMSNDKRAGK